jgi:beta-N-acetylhexosaminidase
VVASQRVDVLMSGMTLDQKIGQVLMLGFVGSSAADAASLISTYQPGSIVFVNNTNDPTQTRALNQGLQSLASQAGAGIPLFIAIDQEGGQVQRLKSGVTYFPSKLTLGATSDVQMAQLEGSVEGKELQALGVNMNLGPVLDVDSNPSNPIIGAYQRSISADAETVANLGGAYIDALQAQQVVAVAKHFPGHGATTSDSHVVLPTLPFSLDYLRTHDLVPFRDVLGEVGGVMTAHISYSNIDPSHPSSLSSTVVEGILRKELGYDGLVMTDDMGAMAAITANYRSGQAAVQAIEAGNDIAMIVGDRARQEEAFRAIRQAVVSGEIPTDRLDQSVRRVLLTKAKFGVLDSQALPEMPDPDFDAVQQVADHAITLVRDPQHQVPASDTAQVLVISPDNLPSAREGTILGQQVAERRPGAYQLNFHLAGANSGVLEQALALARKSNLVIVGTSNAGPWQQGLIEALVAQGSHPIVVGFGNPDEAARLPENTPYIAAYEARPELVEGAVKAIFGEIPISGRLPVPVGPYAVGMGESRPGPAAARLEHRS